MPKSLPPYRFRFKRGTHKGRFFDAIVTILVLFLPLLQLPTSGQAQAKPAEKTARIEGFVFDTNINPVKGAFVELLDLTVRPGEDRPLREGLLETDAKGRYQFSGAPGTKYQIRIGAGTSTYAHTEEFVIGDERVHKVENMSVRVASLAGAVFNENGEPAAAMPFGGRSVCFDPIGRNPSVDLFPKTGPQGEFHFDYVPLDEPFSFWVITSPDAACVWKNVKTGTKDLKLQINPVQTIALPPDWARTGDLEFQASVNTRVRPEGLNFDLPAVGGGRISLKDSQFKNKVLIVNIWGTWCGGCVVEIPQLVSLKEKYASQGLEVVGIAFEDGDPKTHEALLQRFVAAKGINYPVLMGGIMKVANVEPLISGLENFTGFPTTVFLDRSGKPDFVQVGFPGETKARRDWLMRQSEERIERLLR